MSDISKRYVKALVSTLSTNELEEIQGAMGELAAATHDIKFRNIIHSPDLSKEEKSNFLLSLIEKPNDKIANFIKLLVQNGRVDELPHIAKALKSELAKIKDEYEGELISNFEVDASQVKDIESAVSKKLGKNIKLSNVVSDYPGVKVEIDDLGVEVGLSTARLQSQLVEHILKAL